MKKIVCVDLISIIKKVCSFAVFDSSSAFLYQHILNSSDPSVEGYLGKQYKCVCFDAIRTLEVFDFDFLYDVKVLYELKGYKFNNLISLAREVLGDARISKYIDLSDRVNAHLQSYRVSKIDISKYSSDDLFPADTLQSLYKERSSVIVELLKVFDDSDVLEFYDMMYKNVKVLCSIGKVPARINLKSIEENFSHYANTIRNNTVDGLVRLKFNAVGAKTGRLSFKKGSVNVYTLPRSVRKCIEPAQDCSIVQFDFKSLHPRLAIFSTDNNDFKKKFTDIEDIYSIFPGDRDKNKIAFLAWMYSSSHNKLFESEAFPVLDLKRRLGRRARINRKIVTKFGRVLHFPENVEEKVVFQNYITALEVDVILELVRHLHRAFDKRKSRILFPFHDAIICEIHNDERGIAESIKDYMEVCHRALFGSRFPVEVKAGTNFGELDEEKVV